MTQKLLKLSPDGSFEQYNTSIRTLKDNIVSEISVSNYTIDCADVDYVRLHLKTDVTLSMSGAIKEGQQIVLALVQSDTIPHTVTFDSTVRLSDDMFGFPELSTTLGKLDRLIFIFDSIANKYDFVGYSRGY